MIAKLLENIPPESLPREYGGTAPDLYHKKPNTDFITIPRGGNFKKSFTVGPNKGCHIDSYAFEGDVDILVEISTGTSSQTKQLLKQTITIQNKEIRERLLLKYPPNSSEQQTFHVTWSSPSRFHTRTLVYVFTEI